MRTVCDAAVAGSAPARLAVDVFCYRAAKAVGSLAVALGGLDAVVLTPSPPTAVAAVIERAPAPPPPPPAPRLPPK